MSNRIDKPMLSAEQLVAKMRDEKGITFKYTSEEVAVKYLTDVNNYLRTAAYRQNYQKNIKGKNAGKYINLDFAYLQELSTIDMHFRFIISKMCSDIEHALKVQIVKDIEADCNEDGYLIVKDFLDQSPYILGKLNSMLMSPFTGDLLNKYFTVQYIVAPGKPRKERKISAYDDCPVWVLCEFLTFGDVIRLYEFYHKRSGSPAIPSAILSLAKNLRNGAAHNNCLLANLKHGASVAPKDIKLAVQKISSISKDQSKKKLSCRPMLEFVALLYLYKETVTEKVSRHRIRELKELFFVRIPEKRGFFRQNELIISNYEFACKVIYGFFPQNL
ncbi:MAG: Abi family protein [Lachnospiraceae bacterium]|nr:Abi family protein [Lachnospiraceae bacterium]